VTDVGNVGELEAPEGSEPSKRKSRRSKPVWAQDVAERALELRGILPFVYDRSGDILGLIVEAEGLASDRPGLIGRVFDWWYGTRIERAWSLLNEAEARMIDGATPMGIELFFMRTIPKASRLQFKTSASLQLDQLIRELDAEEEGFHLALRRRLYNEDRMDS